MVNVENRKRAEVFIVAGIETSRRYNIQRVGNGHVVVSERIDDPKTIDIVLANCIGKAGNFERLHKDNSRNRIYTAPILYKDGESAFHRVADNNRMDLHHKSLKKYTYQQKQQILRIRKVEELVMQYFGKRLQYYQPESERLPESLRDFRLDRVALDYSHVPADVKRADFVTDCWSKVYKLPVELENVRILAESEIGFRANPDHYWRGRLQRLHTLPSEDHKKIGQFMLKFS